MIAAITDLVVGPPGGPPVVDGVSFAVAPGEVLGLVGRSGSGKTTAALTLLGHVRPGLRRWSGSVQVAGRDPFGCAGELRGRVVSHLGQDPMATLNPSRRVGDLVADVVRLRTPAADHRAEVARLLAAVELPTERAFLRRFPHQISGGQAQRVALAIALAGDPALIVFDEPTSALDAVVAGTVRELIATMLRDRGAAAVLVSHDHGLVGELASRVVTMERGRVVATAGTPRKPVAAVADLTPALPAPARELAVEGLRATHARHTVVDEVSFRVESGGCLALVGPSGSGKSTVSRCLVGLHEPAAGRILLDGQELAGANRRRSPAQRRAVQLVAQDALGALNPRETVRSALIRPLRLAGEQVGLDSLVGELLDRVRLPPDIAGRRPPALSGGERQRVALARALAAGPEVLVCDEVTSALDPDTGGAILELLTTLRRAEGVTILLITHDLNAVARFADEVVVLDAGSVVEAGATGEVLANPAHPLTAALVGASWAGRGEAAAVPVSDAPRRRAPGWRTG